MRKNEKIISIECVSELYYYYYLFSLLENGKRQLKLSNSGNMKRHHFQCFARSLGLWTVKHTTLFVYRRYTLFTFCFPKKMSEETLNSGNRSDKTDTEGSSGKSPLQRSKKSKSEDTSTQGVIDQLNIQLMQITLEYRTLV